MKVITVEAAIELARVVGHAAMQLDIANEQSPEVLAKALPEFDSENFDSIYRALIAYNKLEGCTHPDECVVERFIVVALEEALGQEESA